MYFIISMKSYFVLSNQKWQNNDGILFWKINLKIIKSVY